MSKKKLDVPIAETECIPLNEDTLEIPPMKLVCSCGEPFDIMKLEDGQWVLGHFDKPRTPLISGRQLEGMSEEQALGSAVRLAIRCIQEGSRDCSKNINLRDTALPKKGDSFPK